MANENNNIKELVSEDDDPTAEFDVADIREAVSARAAVEMESDANTYGAGNRGAGAQSGSQSIPELQQDLDQRTKTIGRLQHDIEQLRAKWLGLETEIGAREEIVNNLNRQVDELNIDLDRKDKLLKKRNKAVKTLKSEIRDRDEQHRLLVQEHTEIERLLTEHRSSESEHATTLGNSLREIDEARSKLQSAQDQIITLEADLEIRSESHQILEQQHAALDQDLAEQRSSNAENIAAIGKANSKSDALRIELTSAEEKIVSLETEAARRDERYASLETKNADLGQKFEDYRKTAADDKSALDATERDLEKIRTELDAVLNQGPPEIVLEQTSSADTKDMLSQLTRTEEYADTLRRKVQDLIEAQGNVSAERDSQNRALDQMTERNSALTEELAAANESLADNQTAIEKQRNDHENEIRTLRFELDEAQNTVAETSDMNSQLASELMDTRGFKSDLESMLSQNDEQSQQRIEDLEEQIKRLSKATENFEQKLDTKSTAINVLLGELAKKSEQIDSIGEIEEVIQDIDDRMSGRIDESVSRETKPEADTGQTGNERDRVTRQLVGSIGNQELRFPLFKNRLTIGRTHENDIQLKTSYISRRHAVVLTEGDNTRVIDWGSKNGVFVNAKRVKEHFLSNGDIVSVGNAEFRYEERQMRDA